MEFLEIEGKRYALLTEVARATNTPLATAYRRTHFDTAFSKWGIVTRTIAKEARLLVEESKIEAWSSPDRKRGSGAKKETLSRLRKLEKQAKQ